MGPRADGVASSWWRRMRSIAGARLTPPVEAPALAAPSFRYKLHESMRRSALLRDHGMRTVVWQYNGKLAGYRLAEQCGVPSPKLFRSAVDIDEISPADLAEFGERFVVKPHTGSFSRGVHLLVRQHDDRYVDLTDGAVRTWAEVVSSSLELVAAGGISRRVVVEELLAPSEAVISTRVPDDWKVYCCYDRPVVVMQRRTFTTADSSAWRFRYWSADWDDLGPAMDPARHGPDLEPPFDGAGLIEAAVAIGRGARAPFCRIDLYETDRGVVFGELTPHPGGPQRWRADVDELLGREWEAAEARLMVEGAPSLVESSISKKRAVRSHPDAPAEGSVAANPRSVVEGSSEAASAPLVDDSPPVIHELPGSLVAEMAERAAEVLLAPAALTGSGKATPPSFRARLGQAARQRAMHRTLGMRSVVWQYNGKLAGYELAERCGVARPEVLVETIEYEQIEPDSLPERFVLKPNDGAASRGVYLLERCEGGFRSVLDGAVRTWDDVLPELRALHAERGMFQYSIEELLKPPVERAEAIRVPDDWKVHCFAGRPLLVMQRRVVAADLEGDSDDADADPRRFRYWTTEWRDLGAAKDPETHDPTLEPPVDGAAIVEAAARIGAELRVPFCRIDVYETDRGVVFGEVTPSPGGPQRWRPDVDALLGREWDAAEALLLAEGVNWLQPSTVDPFRVVR